MLFNSCFITARYADLEVADLLASKFGGFVDTLVYSVEFLKDVESDGLSHTARLKLYGSSFQSCYQGHLDNHRKTYSNLTREQRAIRKNGKMKKHLLRLFKTMPSIVNIVVNGSWRVRQAGWCEQAAIDAKSRSHEPFDTTFTCSKEDCHFWTWYQSSRCCWLASPGHAAPDQGASCWRDLMKALNQSSLAIQQIKAETPFDTATMPTKIWKPSFGLCEIMISIFSTLKNLQLCLDVRRCRGIEEMPWESDSFTKALSSAKNLEHLQISLFYDDVNLVERGHTTDFRALLKGLSFPKLKLLNLDQFSADEDEILSLLKASSEIQSLILRRFHLVEGYWTSLVQNIRDTTGIECLQLICLRGRIADIEDGDLIDLREHDLDHVVEDLFYREKGSQITQEELTWIVDECLMDTYDDSDLSDDEAEDCMCTDCEESRIGDEDDEEVGCYCCHHELDFDDDDRDGEDFQGRYSDPQEEDIRTRSEAIGSNGGELDQEGKNTNSQGAGNKLPGENADTHSEGTVQPSETI